MLCEKLHLLNSPQILENQNHFNIAGHHSFKKDLNFMDSNSDSFISNPNLIYKTSSLLFILETIFTNNRIIAIEQLKSIIPFLACEFSPCIQKSFLLIFLKIFSSDYLINSYYFTQKNSDFFNNNNNNNNNTNLKTNSNGYLNTRNLRNSGFAEDNFQNFNFNQALNFFSNNYEDFNFIKRDPAYFIDDSIRTKYISVFLKNKGLEHILAISSISTLDVRIECLKLFDIFSRLSSVLPYNMEEQLIPFIANSIFPLKTPLNDYNETNLNNFIAQAESEKFENENNNKERKFNKEVYIEKSSLKTFQNRGESKINFKVSDLLEKDSIIDDSSKVGKKTFSDSENEEVIAMKQFCFKKEISLITPIAKVKDSPNLRVDSKIETLKITSNEKNQDLYYESINFNLINQTKLKEYLFLFK